MKGIFGTIGLFSLIGVVTSWVPLAIVMLVVGNAQDSDRLFYTGMFMLTVGFLTAVTAALITNTEDPDAKH